MENLVVYLLFLYQVFTAWNSFPPFSKCSFRRQNFADVVFL